VKGKDVMMSPMNKKIIQLYPNPGVEVELKGLYLDHKLRARFGSTDKPFVYSNFVTSLDGRIAIPHPSRPGLVVPDQVANKRDWRLFQELAVQADILITSGRYLRDYADGRAQEILRVYDDPEFADLKAWRLDQGIPLYPDLAVISNSLDFPVPPALTADDRSVLVITSSQANPARIAELETQLAQVIVAGEEDVKGDNLIASLSRAGYRMIYSATGPKVLHLLLAAGKLDRLYLTYANRILGGQPFSTIVDGDLIDPPVDFNLNSLYFDPLGLDGLGQLFAGYNRVSSEPI
jgi:riboflavin biosynthesis pyrimidine reductase